MSLFEEKVKPMLAFLAEPFNDRNFLYEIKFDGTRTLAYINKEKREVKLLNRRGIWFQDRYPEMNELWKDVNGKKVLLDGELVIFKEGKPNFYLLAEREHIGEKVRAELLSKINPATLIVFDILYKDGKDLIGLPLIQRKRILKDTVKESERLILSIYVMEKGKKFFEEVKKQGLEGIMAKRLDSIYEIGKRSKNWLKIKVLQTLDCIICGFTEGSGWRAKYFGALLLGAYWKKKLIYLGRVGTGLDEKGYAELTQKLKKIETLKRPFKEFEEEPEILEKIHWVKPKLVCEVKFMQLTKDFKLRAPSFIRIREDKAPKDCNLEGDIIEEKI
jgi:bifunctional non-homologous end joining protein LigD